MTAAAAGAAAVDSPSETSWTASAAEALQSKQRSMVIQLGPAGRRSQRAGRRPWTGGAAVDQWRPLPGCRRRPPPGAAPASDRNTARRAEPPPPPLTPSAAELQRGRRAGSGQSGVSGVSGGQRHSPGSMVLLRGGLSAAYRAQRAGDGASRAVTVVSACRPPAPRGRSMLRGGVSGPAQRRGAAAEPVRSISCRLEPPGGPTGEGGAEAGAAPRPPAPAPAAQRCDLYSVPEEKTAEMQQSLGRAAQAVTAAGAVMAS